MNKNLISLALTAVFLSACSSNSQNKGGETMYMPVVAEYVTTPDGHEVMTVDYHKLNDFRPFSLDNFLEDIRMVQLDSSNDDAIMGDGLLYEMTDNFYAVRTNEQVKLFKKDGKFISNIGRRGQGPEEYTWVYDIAIDESSNRIYLLEMGNINHLLSYDLEGKFIGRIPLPYTIHKGQMIVEDGKIIVIAMKFDFPEEDYPAIWVQDSDGKIISQIDTPVTTVIPDFSNDIMLSSTSDGTVRSINILYAGSYDGLYSIENNPSRLIPVLKVDFGDMEKIPTHFYTELPEYYIVTFYGDEFEVINGYEIVPTWSSVIIDKKTGKGSYIKPEFGKLGGLLYKGRFFGANDYFVYNVEPGDLEKLIDESLEANPDITSDQEKKLKGLLDNIDLDGNNVIIYGKFKIAKE